MSFRQHNKAPELVWRKKNRARLINAGIPDYLVDDEKRWTYVLLHGDDAFVSGWTCLSLTKQQASELLDLLRRQYPNPGGLDLMAMLEKKLLEECSTK